MLFINGETKKTSALYDSKSGENKELYYLEEEKTGIPKVKETNCKKFLLELTTTTTTTTITTTTTSKPVSTTPTDKTTSTITTTTSKPVPSTPTSKTSATKNGETKRTLALSSAAAKFTGKGNEYSVVAVFSLSYLISFNTILLFL